VAPRPRVVGSAGTVTLGPGTVTLATNGISTATLWSDMPDFTLKAHDRLPSIQASLADPVGVAVDLSGCSVKFIMRTDAGLSPKVNSTATVVDATSGVVRYDWISADTDTAGEYLGEWEVTFVGGKKQTFPTVGYHSITVVPDLDGT
jgi:hypothetical protein